MYLTEALFYTLLVDYLFLTMAANEFSHKQHSLMHESSVKIRPLALRKDVSFLFPHFKMLPLKLWKGSHPHSYQI